MAFIEKVENVKHVFILSHGVQDWTWRTKNTKDWRTKNTNSSPDTAHKKSFLKNKNNRKNKNNSSEWDQDLKNNSPDLKLPKVPEGKKIDSNNID